MKIAVVGCGALGSYYGAKMGRAGHQVHFLLRSDYEIVRQQGVWIESTDGHFHIQPQCARQPEEIGPSDLVLIGLKTTANYTFPLLLPPLVGASTAVLTLQNGLGNEEAVAAVIGPERTMGGLCFVCLNRFAPGRVRHMAHGMVKLGEYGRPPQARTQRMAAAFVEAGIRCVVETNLVRAHWEKLVWNIPFNGLGVAGAAGFEAALTGRLAKGQTLGKCLTTQELLEEPRWEKLVRALMLETIAAARALGLEMPDSVADQQIERTRQMGAYKASTLLDFEAGRELELESLFLEPCRQAAKAGVSCPHLGALGALLGQMAPRSHPAK